MFATSPPTDCLCPVPMLSGVESCASSEDGGASTSSAGSYSTLKTGGSPDIRAKSVC